MERRGSNSRLYISLLLAIGALLSFGAAGASAITVSNLQAAPASDAAGANSDLSLDFDLSGAGAAGQLKDLVIHLPPGLVGNPLATTTCSSSAIRARSPSVASSAWRS